MKIEMLTLMDLRAIALDPAQHTPLRQAEALLKTALLICGRINRGEYPEDRIDSVTWRIADALARLGAYAVTKWPGSPTPGVTEATGLGARLARIPDELLPHTKR